MKSSSQIESSRDAADPTFDSWVCAGRVALALATVAFFVRDVTLGAHTDDVAIVDAATQNSYADLIRAPFFGSFFRPLVAFLLKIFEDTFGDAVVPMRVLHSVLIVASLATAHRIFSRRMSPPAATIALICLFGSPFTFVTAVPFAVGVADLIVTLSLLLSIDATYDPERPRSHIRLIVLSIVAVLSKESGLLVAAYGIVSAIQRRRYGVSAVLALLSAAFIFWRSTVVPEVEFPFDSGFLTEYLDVAVLRRRFADSPVPFYAYNVTASLLTVITSEPNRGYFEASWTDVISVAVVLSTSFLIGRHLVLSRSWRRECAPLIAVVLANSCLGYMYVRPRIMFAAYVAISFLLGFAVDRTLRSGERHFGMRPEPAVKALMVGWTIMLAASVVRVALMRT